MNGSLLLDNLSARGYESGSNVIVIAYLRMFKFKHLPAHSLPPALDK
jgi:hypothetical protein